MTRVPSLVDRGFCSGQPRSSLEEGPMSDASFYIRTAAITWGVAFIVFALALL